LASLVNEHTFFTSVANEIITRGSSPVEAGPHRNLIRRLKAYHNHMLAADLGVNAQHVANVIEAFESLEPSESGTYQLDGSRLGDVQVWLGLVVNGIRAELNTKVFVSIPAGRRYLYAEGPHFGLEVSLKFPSLTFNINEAGKCL